MRKLIYVSVLASMLGMLAGASIGAGTAVADTGHVVTIDDVTFAEGDNNTVSSVSVTARVTPAALPGERVLVDFGTSAQAAQGATATSSAPDEVAPFPVDFLQTDGTVTFEATETAKTMSIPVNGDNADEPDETFFVNLFNGRGECVVPLTCVTEASIGDSRAVVTITDNDATPTLAINNVNHDEGNGPAVTDYDFTVTKTGGSASTVTVGYATADDTATAGSDYTAGSGTVTFGPSSPLSNETQTIALDVTGDTTFEPTEFFKVNLTNPANATISDAEGIGTITNDDPAPAPSMSVADASGAEGGNVNFVITLSSPPGPGQTATVDWATDASGTATAASDYTAASGSSVFTAGESEQTVSVASLEDTIDEPDETIGLVLTRPTPHGTGTPTPYTYDIVDGTAVGTITDDEVPPSLTIDDVTVTEGTGAAPTVATFTVTKTGATASTVTVDYATADVTATAGSDYTASTGQLSFAPADTTKQITVDVTADSLDESNETFTVFLSGESGATVSDATVTGTITDDDEATAGLSIGDATVTEGNSGTTNAVFTVTKTGTSGQVITVDFSTHNGSAKIETDWVATTGTLTFLPADTTKSVTVPVKGDLLDEIDETFVVRLSNAAGASVGENDGEGTGAITDNDAAPKISITNDSVSESSTKACTVTVKLNAPSGRNISVHYATANGTAGTADYVAKSGDLTFVAGDTAEQVKIFAKSDSRNETNETFFVKLSAPSPVAAATFADSSGTCTIIDND